MKDAKELITIKRDGGTYSEQEIQEIVTGITQGSWADYQVSAWLMAVFIRGLNPSETAYLTLAMARSGETLPLATLPKPWVDKHSTGGVGDKTTIVLLPLLAACGLTMVKMSGKGLGITGGTIDKLSTVPGMNLDLTPEEMVDQAARIGLALTGQTPRLAPADKTLYSLRDVTATVPSLPLITSSILSKKIAGGAETVILDVKCGSGAFMKSLPEAGALAESLVRVGTLAGLRVRAVVTDMSQPLGRSVGNALEVKEAIRVLKGDLVGRFPELCLALATEVLEDVGVADPATKARQALTNGAALKKAKEWFGAQGASLAVFETEEWETAPVQEPVLAQKAGWIGKVDAEAVGLLAMSLGGGRKKKEDVIDGRVGIEVLAAVGDEVSQGQPLFVIHAADQETGRQASQEIEAAVTIANHPVEQIPVVYSSLDFQAFA
ncbi:MAG: thymidine phosphorylase [Fimbriimonadaceae bacterium]|nr:thymidine phosphorylase [Fimbriimonadaceae bacterium]